MWSFLQTKDMTLSYFHDNDDYELSYLAPITSCTYTNHDQAGKITSFTGISLATEDQPAENVPSVAYAERGGFNQGGQWDGNGGYLQGLFCITSIGDGRHL